MNSKSSAIWKLDSTLFTLLSWAFLLGGIYCFLWAALIVLGQVVGWLKVGEWQQVPFYSLFLNEEGQRMLANFAQLQPLSLVPSWCSTFSIEEQAAAVAGNAMGVRKIVTWVLELALIVPLLVAGVLLVGLCGWAAEEAQEGKR